MFSGVPITDQHALRETLLTVFKEDAHLEDMHPDLLERIADLGVCTTVAYFDRHRERLGGLLTSSLARCHKCGAMPSDPDTVITIVRATSNDPWECRPRCGANLKGNDGVLEAMAFVEAFF